MHEERSSALLAKVRNSAIHINTTPGPQIWCYTFKCLMCRVSNKFENASTSMGRTHHNWQYKKKYLRLKGIFQPTISHTYFFPKLNIHWMSGTESLTLKYKLCHFLNRTTLQVRESILIIFAVTKLWIPPSQARLTTCQSSWTVSSFEINKIKCMS